MRRILGVILIFITLCGCAAVKDSEPAIEFRQNLAKGNGYTFDVVITADYTDKYYTFGMQCKADKHSNLNFTVTEPNTISGISGIIGAGDASLLFNDQALAFEMMADGQIAPICGPWLFARAMESGFIRSWERTDEMVHLIVDDTFKDEKIQVDIYLTKDLLPIRGEILHQGRRIIALQVENFIIL